jgi:hypothetical protein
MTFWDRLLLLSNLAVWAPVGIGVIARAGFFKTGEHVVGQRTDPSPAPDAHDFRLENDEPEADDPNFITFDDRPLPRGR